MMMKATTEDRVREGAEQYGPPLPPATLHAITVSRGPRTNPRGRKVLLNEAELVPALASALSGISASSESWWSPNSWRGDRRTGKNWEEASAVVIDLDYHDAEGNHVAPGPGKAQILEAIAVAGGVPGNIFHATPRGARLVFVLEQPVRDVELYRKASRGGAAAAEAALKRLGFDAKAGVAGYAVDKATHDLARVFFAPNAIVRGEPRASKVAAVRAEPYGADALALMAPHIPAPAFHPSRRGVPAAAFRAAVARWNEEHPRDFGPAGSGECPACGHRGCFGAVPDDPTRWTCFSSGHEGSGCGRPGVNAGWFGDALDLEAFARRCSRTEVLKADGYLIPDARDRPKNGREG